MICTPCQQGMHRMCEEGSCACPRRAHPFEPPMHNVGPNHPRMTHRQFVEYLFDCAARWSAQPNGADASEMVHAMAVEQQRIDPENCPICKLSH